MNFLLRYTLVLLSLAFVLFVPDAGAQVHMSTYPCAEGISTTSTRTGCIDPKIMWMYYGISGKPNKYFEDKYAAARSAGQRSIAGNPSLHLEAIQTAPIVSQNLGYGCYYDGNTTNDWLYTDYGARNNYYTQFTVEMFGFYASPSCSLPRYYNATTAAIYAYPVCPAGYELFRSQVDNVNEPFGYVCAPKMFSSTTNATPMCSVNSQNSEGACFTKNPIDVVMNNKQETVVDLQTTGPWPIVWSRSYASKGTLMWQFDQNKELLTSVYGDGTARASYRTTYGHSVNFKTVAQANPQGTGVTWQPNHTASDLVLAKLTHTFDGQDLIYTIKDKNGIEEKFKNGRLIERKNTEGFKHFYTYNLKGKLEKIEDEFGHFIAISYAPNGGFVSVPTEIVTYDGPDGTLRSTEIVDVATFTGNTLDLAIKKDMIESVTDGTRSVSYEWSSGTLTTIPDSFYLVSATNSDGTSISYKYGEQIAGTTPPKTSLTGKIDGAGRRINTYGYYANGAANKEWRGGDTSGTAIDTKERVNIDPTIITDQNGFTFTVGKNTTLKKANSFSAKAPWMHDDLKKAYTYDAKGNVLTSKDFNNNTEKRTYDSENRVLTQTWAFGTPLARTNTYTYSGTRKHPDTITENGRTTTFSFNARDQVTGVSVTSGSETRNKIINYTPEGLVESIETPHTTTGFLYDTKGQVSHIIEALGTSLERTTTLSNYHASGKPKTVTHPNGLVTTYQYSPMGMLLSETSQGKTTSYTYDLAGLLTEVSNPDGTKDVLEYSSSQALKTITHKGDDDATVYTVTYTRDNMNQVISETITGTGGTVLSSTSTRNNIGKIQTLADANNNQTTLSYNGEGQVTSQTEPLGRTHTQTFDALNRLATQVLPNSGQTTLTYNADDQVGSAKDARNNQTSYTYNGFGDILSMSSPDRGTWSYTYNLGRLISITDPRGVVQALSYDDLGRVTTAVFDASGVDPSQAAFLENGSETHTYTYDSCKQSALCSVSDAQGATSFSYDSLARLSSVTRTDTSLPALSMAQSYDSAGRVASRTYPSGKVVTYSYDNDSNLSSVTYAGTPVVGATWNALGAPLTIHFGNSLAQAFSYDQNGNVSGVSYPSDTVNYSRDALSRITLLDGTNDQTYAYNTSSEVVSTEWSLWGSPKNYQYDLLGNRLSVLDNTNSGSSFSYDGSSNKMQSFASMSGGTPSASTAVSYDAMGNIVDTNLDTITYDSKGRLAKWVAGGTTTTMYYNALGQRVKKIVSGSASGVYSEFYDPEGRLIGVYTPNGNGGWDVIEELLYLDGFRVVATVRPDATLGMASPKVFPVLTDHLGSPRTIVDQSGVPQWEWTGYEAFGHQAPNELLGSARFVYDGRFAGQRFDESTSSLHNGFRTYSIKLGRYMQSDPLGLDAGWNTYAYAGNSPVSGVDPLGLLLGGLVNAGEKYGEESAQYWADKQVETGNAFYAIPGLLASLWTRCTSDVTASTLLTAGYLGVGVPKTLTHFTKPQFVDSIVKTGLRPNWGVFGFGSYATKSLSKWNPWLPAAKNTLEAVSVSGQGYLRMIPGINFIKPTPASLPSLWFPWLSFGSYNYTVSSTTSCGCK